MSLRYFKKMGDSPVPTSFGPMKFTSIDGGLTAYFATDNPGLHAEFEQCMREQRSAISEISDVEFVRDYLEKKNSTPPRASNQNWRDELKPGQMKVSELELKERLLKAQSVVGVDKSDIAPKPVAVPTTAANAEIAKALPTSADFKPTVGKRKTAKAK